MKKLLLISFLAGLLVSYGLFLGFVYTDYQESSEDQTLRLTKELWKLEKQYSLIEYGITVQVLRHDDLVNKCGSEVFGCTFPDKGEILIRDTRDLFATMPGKERIPFQNSILQHEVLHLVFTKFGMPGDVQDEWIHDLQPYLKKP